jgi:hypothetical protein
MRLFLPLPKAKFDGRTNSIYYYYYYAAYTLNALIMEAVTVVHDPFCEVCGAGCTVSKSDAIVYNPLTSTMTSPSCVKSQAGGQAGVISSYRDEMTGNEHAP